MARADLDWQSGSWGVVISDGGTPGSPSCPMQYPGGTKSGNALEVYYEASPFDWPQLWVFLTDGFWRQTSRQAPFLTSYRLFRYFSSNDENCDRLTAVAFNVLGTNTAGELEVETVYDNHSPAGDRFRVAARVTLEVPAALQTAMRADLTISNASGRAVVPYDFLHRALAEQWTLFGISSMYVADHLTGGLPDWYDGLDPGHRYVGITDDAGFLNDGHSVSGDTFVSTHDTKHIRCGDTTVGLDHDTDSCPIVRVPGYEWYDQLILHGQVSAELLTQHAYRSSRNHRVELLGCSGLMSDCGDLKWAATYNRTDTNLVDGDNIQIKLGMDDVLNEWPEDAVQELRLRLSTGNTRPRISSLALDPVNQFTLRWTTEPGETYALQHVARLGDDWSDIVTNAPGPALGPFALPPGFFRIIEEPGQAQDD